MALHLKDSFHDFGLLPDAGFSYDSLLLVADALYRNTTPYISFPEWEDISAKYLCFSQQTSKVYYELFCIVFGQEECLFLKNDGLDTSDSSKFPSSRILSQYLVPPTQFILYLFNQLFNCSRKYDMNDNDNIIPNAGVYPKKSPKELLDGRQALTQFWRNNSIKWLNLLHILNHGINTSSSTSYGLSRTDVKQLNFLFIGSSIPTNELALIHIKSQFHNWFINHTVEASNLTTKDVSNMTCSVEDILVSILDISLLSSSKLASGNLPVNLLSSWASWSLCTSCSPSFHIVKFTPNGIGFSQDIGASNLLISYKRNVTLVITPDFDASIYIYRCHDTQIYILGAPKNVLITHCRGSRIFVGAVSAVSYVHHCDNLAITGAVGKQIIGQSQDVTVSICTNSSVFVLDGLNGFSVSAEEYRELANLSSLKNNNDIILSPCNQWYDKMAEHMRYAGIDPELNDWDDVQNVWSKRRLCAKLQPLLFFWGELPVSMEGNSSANPFSIPSPYSEWVMQYEKARLIMEDVGDIAAGGLDTLRSKVHGQFEFWLRQTGRTHEIAGLLNLYKDI